MDADSSLSILIKYIHDPSQAQAALAEMQGLKKSTAGVAEAEAEGAESAEKFAMGHREIHQILHLIGHEAGPEAEAAIAALTSAFTAEAIFGVLALRALSEWIEKVKKAEEERAKASAAAWITERDAANDAADAIRAINDELEKSKNAIDDVKDRFSEQKSVLEALLDGHKRLVEAMEKEELAGAKGNKAKEEEIKNRYEDIKRGNDIAAEQAKLQEQQNELTTLQRRAPGLESAKDESEKRLAAAKADKDAADARSRIQGKDEQQLRADFDKATKDLVYWKSVAQNPAASGLGKSEAEFNVAEAQKKIDAFNAYERDLQSTKDHSVEIGKLDAAAKQAVQDIKDNNAAIKEHKDAIDSGKAVLNVHEQTAATEQRLANLARFNGGETGDQAMRDLLGAAGFTAQAQNNVLLAIKKNHDVQQEVLAQIVTELQRMGVWTKDLQSRIDRATH